MRTALSLLIGLVSLQIGFTQPSGNIFGFVKDERNGKPLSAGNVTIIGLDGIWETDSSGFYKINEIQVGEYRIVATAKKYHSQSRHVSLGSGRAEEVNFWLSPRKGVSDTLELTEKKVYQEIKGLVNRGHEATGTFRLTSQEIYRSPSTLGDISRVIQTLPGVNISNDQINDLLVRGGGPNENTFLLDGIPTLKINHYDGNGTGGGRIGNVNLYFVDQMSFHNGAFSSRYPDKMSSVTELLFREGNLIKNTGMLTFDIGGAGGVIEGPYKIGGQKGSYAFTGRYSFLDILDKMGALDVGGIPEYQNGHLKLFQPLSPNSKLKFNILGGKDAIHTSENVSLPSLGVNTREFVFGSHNIISGLGWDWSHKYGKTKLIGHYNRRQEEVETIYTRDSAPDSSDFFEKTQEQSWGGNFDHTFFMGDYVSLGFGTQYMYFQNRRELERGPTKKYITLSDTSATVVDIPAIKILQEPGSFSDIGMYMEIMFQNKWVDVTLGGRLMYEELVDSYGFGPRAGLRWNINKSHVFKSAFGIHYQPHFWLNAISMENYKKAELPYNWQSVIGWEWRPTANLFFQLEGYEKRSFRLAREALTLRSDGNGRQILDTGKVKSRGFELYVKKDLTKKLFFSGTYNFNYTREIFPSGKWKQNFSSIPQSFNTAIGWEFSQTFGISGRYAHAVGTPYTPVDPAASIQTGTAVYNPDELYSKRSPDFSRLDLRVDFRNSFKGFSITSFFEFSNVLMRKNEFGRFWDRISGELVPFYGFTFLPVGGIVVAF